MHNKNILHRDIKSQNMFLTKEGTLKIGDFGISRQVETLSALNMTACGTPYFMPPEVCKGEPYGPKADIWAVGCILYELITKRKPFDSENITGVFEQIKSKALDPLPPNTDRELIMLINKMLNKNQAERPYASDIARIPCINKRIRQFVIEKDCADTVISVFNINEEVLEPV